ncbi:hypothetical protein [Leptotrichia sp. oral taxon 417]|nr:hypothetical protein [Leptotrichia sp. oral taxon 417]
MQEVCNGITTGLRLNTKYLDFDFGYAKPMAHSDYLNPKKQIYTLAEI